MICCTSRDSRSDSVSIRPAKRRTATGSSAASHAASASSLIAPTGVLQLVGDVRHEVATHLLDPTLARAVLDQREHQRGGERSAPDRHVAWRRALTRHQQLRLADLAVTADLGDQLGERWDIRLVPDTRPIAYAGALAFTTVSSPPTTTALLRRTDSTEATPAGTAGSSTSGAIRCWRSLTCHATNSTTRHERSDERREKGLRGRVHVTIVRSGSPAARRSDGLSTSVHRPFTA